MNIAGIQAVTWPSPKLGHFLWQAVDDSSVGTWINTSKQYMHSTWGQTRYMLGEIRACTNKGWALGSGRFQSKMERLTERRAVPLPKGAEEAGRSVIPINRV
jgi:hypothetical protein